jgi:hypothetical protein
LFLGRIVSERFIGQRPEAHIFIGPWKGKMVSVSQRFVPHFAGVLASALVLLLALPASAQTARDREEAANAYDRGVSAFLSEDFAAASHWFETANRLAPSPAALIQAIRSNERAGNDRRAASMALHLADAYPDETNAIAATEEIRSSGMSRYYLVTVRCDATCAIAVDGALTAHNRFFIDPNTPVTVSAEFPGGTLTEEVTGLSGGSGEVAFVAPPPPPEPVAEETRSPGTVVAAQGEGDSGMGPGVFYTGLGLTVASGAVLAWSGANTLKGVDAYEASPTEERLSAGQSKELRTNILIGVTGGLAAATALIAVFTDFSGDDEDSQGIQPTVGLSTNGLVAGMEGSF